MSRASTSTRPSQVGAEANYLTKIRIRRLSDHSHGHDTAEHRIERRGTLIDRRRHLALRSSTAGAGAVVISRMPTGSRSITSTSTPSSASPPAPGKRTGAKLRQRFSARRTSPSSTQRRKWPGAGPPRSHPTADESGGREEPPSHHHQQPRGNQAGTTKP